MLETKKNKGMHEVPDPNPKSAVPVRCGVRRSVARRVPGTLWTVGTARVQAGPQGP